MQYLGIESNLNPENERDAIIESLNKYWDISIGSKKSITEAIDYILKAGIKYGIALQEKEVQEAVEVYNQFVIVNNNSGNVDKIDFKRTTTDEDIVSYFSSQVGCIESVLRIEWLISAQPKDYETFKQSHDADDFADNDEELEFRGSKLHGSIGASCPRFSDCLKKGNVYHSEESQGRSPLEGLVGAVYRQGMNIGTYVVEQKWGTKSEIYHKKLSK